MKKTNFYIRHFDDYHEIYDSGDGFKSVELGCFPPKNRDYGYNRYFGLFYKGRKPSFKSIWPELKKKVRLGGYYHYRTGENIGLYEEELVKEIKEVLK